MTLTGLYIVYYTILLIIILKCTLSIYKTKVGYKAVCCVTRAAASYIWCLLSVDGIIFLVLHLI